MAQPSWGEEIGAPQVVPRPMTGVGRYVVAARLLGCASASGLSGVSPSTTRLSASSTVVFVVVVPSFC